MSERFDLVILGAGLSGLALAGAVARSGRRLRTLIIEPRRVAPNPRHWLFPAAPGHGLRRYESSRLTGFEVESPTGAVLHRPLNRMILARVSAQAVQDAALDAIAAEPRMRLEEGASVDQVQAKQTHVALETSEGQVRASWLVDTRPLEDVGMPAGRVVQLSRLMTAPREAGHEDRLCLKLMGSETPGLEQLSLSPDRIVHEQARFVLAPPPDLPPQPNPETMLQWGGRPEAVRHAQGVWPLSYRASNRQRGRVVLAPADAYGLRFAPGMAALRLHDWAHAQARRLSYGLSLCAPPPPPLSARLSTARIEMMIRRDPRQAAARLRALLYDAPADGVMRTLSGAARWTDLVRAWRSGTW
ncbi:lycopene cyclase family protein [Oceanicaulis sp.]|uniref:lycopene cyclase family protein n=1 Tax=Oceanicaulis sp. TaxID=1924941 RepID=UPI003BA918B9